MFKFLYSSLIIILILTSCKSEVNDNGDKNQVEKEPTQIDIETLFDDVAFPSDKEIQLLKELEICNPEENDLKNHSDPACHPKFFRFFQFKVDSKIENSFALLIKSRVQDFPLRRVLVFERENGKLVKVNGFVANLIGLRKSKTKYKDLILRFNDEVGGGEVAFYNCVFTWQDKHYVFKSVEQINDLVLKSEYQDSMNVEIQNILIRNRMLF